MVLKTVGSCTKNTFLVCYHLSDKINTGLIIARVVHCFGSFLKTIDKTFNISKLSSVKVCFYQTFQYFYSLKKVSLTNVRFLAFFFLMVKIWCKFKKSKYFRINKFKIRKTS